MMRYGALSALILALTLPGCMSSERPSSSGGKSGSGDDGGSGGGGASGGSGGGAGGASGGSGGSAGSAGSGGSGGKAGSGGSGGSAGSTGGAGGSTGGSGGSTGGAGGSTSPDAGTTKADSATSAWPNCLEPVFSGVAPSEFCMVYANVCTFTGTSHYASMADCMAKFKGMSNDGDACKSGHLCRAATMPSMKEADCASSGTAQCRN